MAQPLIEHVVMLFQIKHSLAHATTAAGGQHLSLEGSTFRWKAAPSCDKDGKN
jgi:hypothetical protein